MVTRFAIPSIHAYFAVDRKLRQFRDDLSAFNLVRPYFRPAHNLGTSLGESSTIPVDNSVGYHAHKTVKSRINEAFCGLPK